MIQEMGRECGVLEAGLWERAERYQGAKVVLLSAEEGIELKEATAEFAAARAELRSALEEIWPDREGRGGNYGE
ncbi:MAG: hypothetical protein ABIY70_24455 [Capsulimonas sp.]|uniref:hypothetical protein n=1 Tax=Capsulimonas sp. TaxID=2494211 RepID=UPI003265D611